MPTMPATVIAHWAGQPLRITVSSTQINRGGCARTFADRYSVVLYSGNR